MGIKDVVDEFIDRSDRFRFIERSPRTRVLLTFLFYAAVEALAAWGLLGWSLAKSLPADIGGGLGMAFVAVLRERRRARRRSELTR